MTTIRLPARTAAVAIAAVLLVAGSACGRAGPDAAHADRDISCSPAAQRSLSAVESAIRSAAVAEALDVSLIGVLGECSSGSRRAVEADIAPTLGVAESFVRRHFDCGSTSTESAVPEDLEQRYDWDLEPSRVMDCTIGGVGTTVTVYDEAEWDVDRAGINVLLAKDE